AYVDAADLHLVSAAEVVGWDLRRFRPNVVVDWPGSLDELVGERIRLGTVVADVTQRTRRCAMPTARQPGLSKDVGVLRTIARQRDMCLGVYAQVVRGGAVHVGDVLSTT
ncbi:MAG: MOSC domain-containing protein, partial [Frankiales bacterium]|nr:MOSC domain-containing protein [Frankiales bacterium]